MTILSAEKLSKRIKDRDVLLELDFSLEKGRCIGIAGETGSGKTSFLEILGGRGQASSGTVFFHGKKVPGTREKLVPGHRGIGYLSQHFELPPHYWVHEILSYAGDLSDSEREYLYILCRISHLTARRTDELSGGERQRVALARELLTRPDVLLLDEPFSNLDAHNKRTIRQVLADLRQQWGLSQVLVSHEATDILPWADEMYLLRQGRWVQQGPPRELYARPVSEYVAGLLGEYSLIDPWHPSFAALPFAAAEGTQWLIRPEHVLPAPVLEKQLTARVLQVEFRGAWLALRLDVQGQSLLMYTASPGPEPGQTIGIRIAHVVEMAG